MLREIPKIQQHPGEHRRRWFAAESMDLFVWIDDTGAIVAFQLAYDKPHAERAITWRRDTGFSHTRVDEGANPGGYPVTPLLVEDGMFESSRVIRMFRSQANEVDEDIVHFVTTRLLDYPQQPASSIKERNAPSGSVLQQLFDLLRSGLNRFHGKG